MSPPQLPLADIAGLYFNTKFRLNKICAPYRFLNATDDEMLTLGYYAEYWL